MSHATAITWLTFPTLGRRRLLERAIRTYARNLDRSGRATNILVVDGSPHDEGRGQDLGLLRVLSAATGRKTFYVGAREKRAFVDWLASTVGIPPQVGSFALFGVPGGLPAYGAGRNAILLAAAGCALLSADDDTVGLAGSMTVESRREIRVEDSGNPEQVWFHDTRGQAVRSMQSRSADLLSWHEWMLGSALSIAGVTGRVAAVSTGVVGDCAMSSHASFVATTDESTRSRLLASEDAYRRALSSREIVRHALHPTVSGDGGVMMTSTSLDNRGLLPPFMPVGRNEDGLFGQLLRRCCPGALIGHLPLAILHAPSERRAFDPNPLCMRLSEVIQLCVEEWSRSAASPASVEQGLASVGRYLDEIGSLPQADFGRAIHSRVCGAALGRIEFLLSLLDRHGHRPQYWAEDIGRQILFLERAAVEPWFSVPQDLRRPDSAGGGMVELKGLLRQYGRLLSAWPAIVSMTARAGYRLATAVGP